MTFSILKDLLSSQRYLSFCVMQISKLMMSSVVPSEDGSHITSAKFEEHRSNISKDILHFVICPPLEPLMTSPVFLTKT